MTRYPAAPDAPAPAAAPAAALDIPDPSRYRHGTLCLHEYLRLHARSQPHKPAFIWYGRAITYGELDAWSDAFAVCLAEQGVAAGERVALFMNNCPQYIVAHFAIQKLGAVVGPCGPLFKAAELEYQLRDLGARIVVAADNLQPVLAAVQAATSVTRVYCTHYGDLLPAEPSLAVPDELRAPRTRPAGTLDFLEAIAAVPAGTPVPRPDTPLDDVCLMTYTSGTTGLPKGAMLSYRNALFKTGITADCNDVRGDDVLLAIAPIYHIAGMLMGINATVYTGCTSVLLYRFDPLAVLQAIDRYKVTWWYGMAPMNVAVMQVPGADRFDLSSLRLNPTTSFGITLTEPLAEQWRVFTGGARCYEAAYGLSETHTCDTFMPSDAVRWGCHGRLAPGVQCRIVDPDTGIERPVGEPGEITLRSPGNFIGYWNRPEATASTLRNGWVHTGDMGRLDADGYLTFMGRFKEMIKVSGYSVFPEEVETLLIRHPGIAAAAVIGVPDATKGEVVKAVIVPRAEARAGLSAEAIIAWSRENMSAYKVPRFIEFRDALPATGAGKVLRRLLKS
ncbi:MAG: AMP-binding protein [Burkholderiaceae bacterium]|nr:AMP-binding protein [Burkholderiaceae bacterium]MBP8306226.1 AMP-binding protein [Burkholderiaceae bacterium]